MFTSKQNIEKASGQFIKKCGFSKVGKTEVFILQGVSLTTFQKTGIGTEGINFSLGFKSELVNNGNIKELPFW